MDLYSAALFLKELIDRSISNIQLLHYKFSLEARPVPSRLVIMGWRLEDIFGRRIFLSIAHLRPLI